MIAYIQIKSNKKFINFLLNSFYLNNVSFKKILYHLTWVNLENKITWVLLESNSKTMIVAFIGGYKVEINLIH